jgi:hypothetical protein
MGSPYFQRTVVPVSTTFNIKGSALVRVTETQCVSCEVQTESLNIHLATKFVCSARGSAVASSTMLQARRSRVRFPMSKSPMSASNIPGRVKGGGAGA